MPRVLFTVLAFLALLTTTTAWSAPAASAMEDDDAITLDVFVIGAPIDTPTSYVVVPHTAGCSNVGFDVFTPGAGAPIAAPVAGFTTGPLRFSQDDFDVRPTFNGVETFRFAFSGLAVEAGQTYNDPAFADFEYSVSGSLAGTPSGFPAFSLKRSIAGTAAYTGQGSSLAFAIGSGADLSDGVQVDELTGTDPVLTINAREVDTGRYHPPLIELASDGTGRIQNSNNSGGTNPATNQVVDVDFGEEYITEVRFDPATTTVIDTVRCRYSVELAQVAGYQLSQALFDDVEAGQKVTFVYVQQGYDPCETMAVTIDMNTNGGIGTGTPGNDVILGTPGDDVIDAGEGHDVICAGEGNDLVQGGRDDDLIVGGPGNDRIFGSQGADVILGGAGDDTIHGNRGNDQLFGGDGADRIYGYSQPDLIVGGPGDDGLHGNGHDDRVIGGDGIDRVFGYQGDDLLYGGPGDDILRGNRDGDTLFGQFGEDLLIGSDGNDVLYGGADNDSLHGNSGADALFGRTGDDLLDGGIDDDVCDGETGTDETLRCERREDGL